ncbi:MAG: DUF4178 domain-containing protein [Chloroflexi bacterium]|nr:DUF4178 domain-containing protein [Chloroflexota bacterium]
MGLGLIGLGAVLGGLAVLWLIVTAASGDLRGGGFVLGLMLAAILGLPPIFAGYVVLRRSREEAVALDELVGHRRVLEQDRLFRTRIATEARQQAARLAALADGQPQLARAAARLKGVADDLESSRYDESAWYETVELADEDVAVLGRYDDLVSERLRRIARQVDALELGDRQDAAGVLRAAQTWERDLDQRLELLRGERPPTRNPSDLLAAEEPARGAEVIAALAPGDAITYEGVDYLVELTITYFASGRAWTIHRLGAEDARHWLYVAPGGLALAMLELVTPSAEDGAREVRRGDSLYRLTDEGAASITVTSARGREEGLGVDFWHYQAPTGGLYWQERWPDEPRAYEGAPIPPRALEIWPAERTTPT